MKRTTQRDLYDVFLDGEWIDRIPFTRPKGESIGDSNDMVRRILVRRGYDENIVVDWCMNRLNATTQPYHKTRGGL